MNGNDLIFIIGIMFYIVLGPWLLIWSLNTLLGTSLELTFWTWLAGFILIVLFRGKKSL